MTFSIRRLLALCVLSTTTTLSAQDGGDAAADARGRALEAKTSCVNRLEGTDGVGSVNFAGAGTDYRFLVIVRDPTVKEAARKLIGGDKWEGFPILWLVTRPAAPPPSDPAALETEQEIVADAIPQAPEPAAGETAPQARPPGPQIPDCDIVRAQLRLPAVRHPVGNGSTKSWIPCKVWLRAVQGPGGGHSYLHTKHRPSCPFQDGLVSQVYREGFLYPTDLRASDSLWGHQVKQDLGNRPQAPPPPQRKPAPVRKDVPTGDPK